jgi:hypothetical protein
VPGHRPDEPGESVARWPGDLVSRLGAVRRVGRSESRSGLSRCIRVVVAVHRPVDARGATTSGSVRANPE